MVNETFYPDESIQSTKGGCRLGPILRIGRERKDIFQVDLAKKLGIKAPAISNFEKGLRFPSISQLAQLSEALDLDLQTLILSRTYDEIYSDDPSNWPENILTRRDNLLEVLRRYIEKTEDFAKLKEKLGGRSFVDFPGAFPRIKIVTGDRRENPPKTTADIGAYSVSPVDDRWIYSLRLPEKTEKVSDKEFVLSTEERLIKRYGNCTLLVIGSPAGNHLARKINSDAIFRFNLQQGYEKALEDVINDRYVEKSGGSVPAKKEEHLKDLKRMMMQFFAFGIIDPVSKKGLRGFALSGDVDYGTITFAKNPYYQGDDYRYIAIMVAGFHHPGTIWALRQLSNPRDENEGFVYRPYGGVVKIEIDTEKAWDERMRKASCSWDTDPYSKKDLLRGLDELQKLESSLMQISPAKVEQCKKLLMSL